VHNLQPCFSEFWPQTLIQFKLSTFSLPYSVEIRIQSRPIYIYSVPEVSSCGGLGGLRPTELISAPLAFSSVQKNNNFFFGEMSTCQHYDMSTWQILDRLLSRTNFPHKHHGAIPSRYAQIRAGEFGGRRTKEEDNWFSKGLISHVYHQTFRKPAVLLRPPSFVRQNTPHRHTTCARCFLFGTKRRGGLPVSTVRLGVQYRRPKAASPPQELEVRAAGGRANF
jgi:hypothetical protein